LLKQLANYAADHSEKELLTKLGSQEGREDYRRFVIGGFKSLVRLLQNFPSCKPPLFVLLEFLPRLKPRFYSVSSSPKNNRNAVAITVSEEKTTATDIPFHDELKKKEFTFKGVASTYLSLTTALLRQSKSKASLNYEPRLPIFLRQGRVVLPQDPSVPIIMIGAGTGLAPFIGFIQEREMMKKERDSELETGGKLPANARQAPANSWMSSAINGATAAIGIGAKGDKGGDWGGVYLYFGCRREDEDFMYKDYLEDMLKQGVLTELNVAFSRQGGSKKYVQHLILRDKQSIWKTLEKDGIIYVGGDAGGMGRGVNVALALVVQECGRVNDGEEFLNQLRLSGRYQLDVWSAPYSQLTHS